jgi:hypothetical protein
VLFRSLGLEGPTVLVTLLIPLLLVYMVPPLRRGEKLDFGRGSVVREIILWAISSIIAYSLLLALVIPRGYGPAIPYTREIMGAFYAIVGNIPSLLLSFMDETPLNAIKEATEVFTVSALAGFAYLTFCGYLIYVFRQALKNMQAPYIFPVRLLITGLSLTFLLTIFCVSQAQFKVLFNFYILIALIMAIYYTFLESDHARLSKILLLACSALVILSGASNLASITSLADKNPSRAVIQHRNAIERIAADFGISDVYALFPDSLPLEALTDGRLKVGALLPDLTPFTYGTVSDRFNSGLITRKVAFILPLKGKSSKIYAKVEADPLLGKAVGHLRVDDKDTPIDVFIFDSNPFTFAGKRVVFPDLEEGPGEVEAGEPPGGDIISYSESSVVDNSLVEPGHPEDRQGQNGNAGK